MVNVTHYSEELNAMKTYFEDGMVENKSELEAIEYSYPSTNNSIHDLENNTNSIDIDLVNSARFYIEGVALTPLSMLGVFGMYNLTAQYTYALKYKK